MDHLFDCEFRCEDRYARRISVDLGKTILVAPELAGFSHSQGPSPADPRDMRGVQPDKRGDRRWVGGNHALALDLACAINDADRCHLK